MTPRCFALLAALALAPASASAGSCDGWVKQSKTATGTALVSAYAKLLKCDRSLASDSFDKFMLQAQDMDTLVPLTLTAIDGEVFVPVWNVIERLPYEFHAPLAEGVGAACAEHDKVEPFIQGAYTALKGTEFTSWQPAIAACASEGLVSWLEGLVADPPSSPYNDKYNAVITTYVALKGVDAIPALEQAAIAASQRGGPFDNLLETLQQAVKPKSYREEVSPENKATMEEAMVRIAQASKPDEARLVADRLYTTGSETLAASLLPAIYPDRVQSDGTMLWAGAAVESCDGAAWIHWTAFTAKPVHWSIVDRVSDPLRSTKARLKCSPEGEWPVFAPDAPLADQKAVDAWVDGIEEEWTAKGLKVKSAIEKKVSVQ